VTRTPSPLLVVAGIEKKHGRVRERLTHPVVLFSSSATIFLKKTLKLRFRRGQQGTHVGILNFNMKLEMVT